MGATVVHPATGAVERDATVVLEGDHIRYVGPNAGARPPAGARIIDAHGKWLVPGYVDTHVHFFQSGNLYTRPDALDLRSIRPYAEEDARNRRRLPETFATWIRCGVTSVVDVGGPFWNFDVREQARRTPEAPNGMVAGPLISFIADEPLDVSGDAPIRKVTTSEAAVALARAELARKPDFIKVWFIREEGDDLKAKERIVKDVADVTHAAGVRLAVHSTELETAKAALRAGADVLVHSVDDEDIDDEFVGLAHARKVVYVPTLVVYAGYGLALSNQWKPTPEESRFADPDVLRDLGTLNTLPQDKIPGWLPSYHPKPEKLALNPIAARNLRRMWREGFVVPVGTDAGNIGTVHGPSFFRETTWMAEAGLTAAEVLRAATTNGASMMAREREVGDVHAGMVADLVLLDRDPLVDVHNLSAIDLVVRAGNVFGGTRAGAPR